MNYTQFISTVVEEMKTCLPAEAVVKIHNVTKNNSIHLDGLSIFYKKSNISPNIYLNYYYEDYLRGENISEITDRILSVFTQFHEDELFKRNPFEHFTEPDPDKIFYRLINYGKNEELLKESPHIQYLDLAITFHYLLNSKSEGIESFRINNHMMEVWNLSPKLLYEKARFNTEKLFHSIIRPMDELLIELMKNNRWGSGCELKKSDFSESNLSMMYVLSTRNGIYGATAILYPYLMSEFARKLESDFYVIPSSIHEMLLIPSRFAPSLELLREMIGEVNKKEVPVEDVLSDNPYFYDRKTGKLRIPR